MVFAHVTVYGVVDNVFTSVGNRRSHANFHMSQGNRQASKFGLRGAENIGGGTEAVLGSQAASNR